MFELWTHLNNEGSDDMQNINHNIFNIKIDQYICKVQNDLL